MKLDCKLHLAHCYTARHAMDAVCFPFSHHKTTTLTLAGVALCRLLLWPVFLATRDWLCVTLADNLENRDTYVTNVLQSVPSTTLTIKKIAEPLRTDCHAWKAKLTLPPELSPVPSFVISVQGVDWPFHSLHWNNAYTNIRYATTSLTNNMCTILSHDFSKEQHELPEDEKQCATETCRSLLSVLVF
jgi:hypothetical protein